MLLLAGSLFSAAASSRVHAAPAGNPLQDDAFTDTPTDTLVPTDTETATFTATFTFTATLTITPTFTATATPTDTPTLTATPTGTGTLPAATSSLTSTLTAPNHIVISEFRTTGPLGASDEFVEIYNPTGGAANIAGWSIKKSSACATNAAVLVTFLSGTILQPGQHYLAAPTNDPNAPPISSINNADQPFSPGIADTGGLALVTSAGAIIDKVGMCADTAYQEGTALAPLSGISDQSYERKPGGNTSCYDTADNDRDFALISPAHPQNKNNTPVMCAGVVLSSPTRTPTRTFTRTPTRTRTPIPGSVILNEFLPHPHTDWNHDGKANVGDEYIELINMGSEATNIKNWKLDGGAGSDSFLLPDVTLQPRQISFFFHSQTGLSLSDGGGTVRLLKADGYVADAFTYPVVEKTDITWCRLPDGTGTWGFSCAPSPGLPNGITHTFTPSPEPAGIWKSPGEDVFWLQNRWKWDVFVE